MCWLKIKFILIFTCRSVPRFSKCILICVLIPRRVFPLYRQIVHLKALTPWWASIWRWAAKAVGLTAPQTGHLHPPVELLVQVWVLPDSIIACNKIQIKILLILQISFSTKRWSYYYILTLHLWHRVWCSWGSGLLGQ